MRHATILAFAAAIALGAFGGIPDTEEGWYTPENYEKTEATGTMTYGYDVKTHTPLTQEVNVDANGNADWTFDTGSNFALATAWEALKEALKNTVKTSNLEDQVKTIAKNLHSVFEEGINLTITRDSPGGGTRDVEYKDVKLTPSDSGPAKLTGRDETPINEIIDNKSLTWTQTAKPAHAQIAGFEYAGTGDPVRWWANENFYAPVKYGNNMLWLKYCGINWHVFEEMGNSQGNKLTLAGFGTDSQKCEQNLEDIMTDPELSGFRSNYRVLAQYGSGSGAELKYIPLDGLIKMDGVFADDTTITTNEEHGAKTQGEFSLYGWMDSSGDAKDPYIPFDNGSIHLCWQSVLDFFNKGIFELNSSGKINLKGVSGDANEVRVLTATVSDGSSSIQSSSIANLVQTPVVVDDSTKKITIGGWKTGTPASGKLSDKLRSGDENNKLLIRDSQGEVGYLTIGQLGNIVPDEKSTTTNNQGQLKILGVDLAPEGSVLYRRDSGYVEWKMPKGEYEPDDATVTTNESNGALFDGYLSLAGFASADDASSENSPSLPYADGSSVLMWQGIIDFFNDGIFELNSQGKVNLKGVTGGDDLRVLTVSGSSGEEAIATKTASEIVQGAIVVDTETKKIAIDGWKTGTPSAGNLATLLVDGPGQGATPPALFARDASGNAGYVSIGRIAKLPPDSKSIVSNENARLALKGYDTAAVGTVAHKTADGLEWKAPERTAVDGTSITTNTANGAVVANTASIYGFSGAAPDAIPRKDSNNKIAWSSVDNSSIAWAVDGGTKSLEVKGASVYGGHYKNKYFGTDSNGTLGWHECANVSTNTVKGDEVTIETDPSAVPAEAGIKKLGLKGWSYNYGGSDPLYLMNVGGSLAYGPLSLGTNDLCACSNKWNNVVDWLQVGEHKPDEIKFPNDAANLNQYLTEKKGHVYMTHPANNGGNYFDNTTASAVSANFNAPVNWADGVSVGYTNGAYQIKDFAQASACNASMSDMLSDPAGSDAQEHLLLSKNTRTGTLHYVPIGNSGVGSALKVTGTDNNSVTVGYGAHTNHLTFASAADSNVHVEAADDGNGGIVVTIGVYYLQESNLNGGSGGGSGL